MASPFLQTTTSAALFTVVAAVSATQLYVNWLSAGFEPSYRSLVGAELTEWWMWALTVPLVVLVHKRSTAGGGRWGKRKMVVVHAALATGVFALQNVILVLMIPWVDPAQAQVPFVDAYLSRGMLRLTTAWVVYAFIVGVVWILQDALRRERLTKDLYDAQLRALRAQIHPHFLFNTLHAAAALIRSGDRDESIQTLVSLSELLRRSLNHSRSDEVPLVEELEFLEIYLSIQRTRFGANLVVDLDVDEETHEALVPPLILQPLVENSIRHGLDLSHTPGAITVVVRAIDGSLRIVVEDDGGRLEREPPVPDDGQGGIGLANLKDRLVRLYGPRQALALKSTAAGTTAVTVDIPFRTFDRGA